MNKTERAYADRLELLKRAGEIRTWRFEPVKFRLGHTCWYCPDFEVVTKSGELEYHEVKGFWRDDARVKIKTAASMYRDRAFIAVQWKKKAWVFEPISPCPGG
jgi:hypothetical protein